MSLLAFIIIIILSTATYGIRLAQLVIAKGVDPTLATYSNPMLFNSYTSYRLFLIGALLISLSSVNYGKFAFTILAIWLIEQTILLYLFERQQTQPVLYYLITACACTSVLFFPKITGLTFFIILVALEEVYLRKWIKTKQARYDKWIAQITVRLDTKYHYIAKGMRPEDWFNVLHVAVTESVARPKISRLAELLYWHVKRPKLISTGIMQIQSNKPMNDAESMERGAKLVVNAMQNMPIDLVLPEDQITWLAKSYNGSSKYSSYLFSTYKGVAIAWEKIKY